MSISSTLLQGADIRFVEAASALRSHVGCFWIITAERGAFMRVVPDASTAISMLLQDAHPPEWSLRGPLRGPDEHRFAAPATLVGVRLRPGVAFLVTAIEADVLVNQRILLSDIPACREFARASGRPQTPEQHIAALERFLIDRLRNASVHGVVHAAVQEIEREHGQLSVVDVAARCGVSPRHLNRLMRLWVGYGAKRFANIIRFQATLHRMEQLPREPAAALAYENGYFDQSHLTGAVARLAGSTPGHLASRSMTDFSKTRCDDLP